MMILREMMKMEMTMRMISLLFMYYVKIFLFFYYYKLRSYIMCPFFCVIQCLFFLLPSCSLAFMLVCYFTLVMLCCAPIKCHVPLLLFQIVDNEILLQKMSKDGKFYLRPGSLAAHGKNSYLQNRNNNIKKNSAMVDALNLKQMPNPFKCSAQRTNGKRSHEMDCALDDDPEYQSAQGEDGISSSSEDDDSLRARSNKVMHVDKEY